MEINNFADFLSELELFSINVRTYNETGYDLTEHDIQIINELDIIFRENFGYCTTQHIWNYVFNKPNNKFESFEELSEFLSDPCCSYISDTPVDITILRKNFPKIGMIKNFAKYIRKYGSE